MKSLSAKGKADRLDPKSAEALEAMARTSAALDKFDHDTDMKEAVLVNVPAMDATATAEAAIDVEVRQWCRRHYTTHIGAHHRHHNSRHRRRQYASQQRPLSAALNARTVSLDGSNPRRN